MRGTTHITGGAAALAIMTTSEGSEFQTLAVGTVIGVLGGLLPDIDHPNSKITHETKSLGTIISRLSKHRGVWHTPFLYACVWGGLRLGLRESLWVNFLFAGIASHLLLDLLNPTGIPILFPFTTRKFHLARIRTGGKTENMVSIVLALTCLLPVAARLGIL